MDFFEMLARAEKYERTEEVYVLMVHYLFQWLRNNPQSRSFNQEKRIEGRGGREADLPYDTKDHPLRSTAIKILKTNKQSYCQEGLTNTLL